MQHILPARLNDVQLMTVIGEHLYGDNWRRPMGRALGVSHALLAAIASGRRQMSADVRQSLARLCAVESVDAVRRAADGLAVLREGRDRYVESA